MNIITNFIRYGFFCFIDLFKFNNYLNFSASTDPKKFRYTLLFEAIAYLLILGSSILLILYDILIWIVPLLFILYRIPFYSFLSRCLNYKYNNTKVINTAVCIISLFFVIINIASFSVYFGFMYEIKDSIIYQSDILVYFIAFNLYVMTFINIIIRIVLIILCIS